MKKLTNIIISLAVIFASQAAFGSAITDMAASGYTVLTNGSFSTGSGVTITGNLGAKGDIWLDNNAQINGNVNTSSKMSTGSNVHITGDLGYEKSLWMPNSSVVDGDITKQKWNTPQIDRESVFAGKNSLYYANNSTVTLSSGSYSSLSVSSGSTVYLSSGTYNFTSAWFDRNVNLILDTSAGEININTTHTFTTGSNVNLGFTGSGMVNILSAGNLYIGSGNTINANLLTNKAGSIDNSSVVNGLIFASNSLWLGNDTVVSGRVADSPVVPEPATALLLLAAVPYMRNRLRKHD